jgi:hypothetical protein
MKKIVKLTESDLRRMIGNIVSEQSTMDMSEYSEGFMNKIVDKFKQEASQEVEMYVKRFKEISSNLENKDITQYSWNELKDVVESYKNKDHREWSKGLEKQIDQDVDRIYGDRANDTVKNFSRDFLRKQEMDRVSQMTPDWKERLSEQSNPQDEIKRLNIEIEKLKKQLAANQMELKKRANLDQRVQQLAKGPKKSMEEQLTGTTVNGTPKKETFLSRFPKTEKHQLWDFYLQMFGPSSMKHIKMKDDYSLNWGSHSGKGFDWGMSISKSGTFAFQTTNKEKKAIVEGLIKQYNIPFRSGENQGNYSVHSMGKQNIYDVDEDNMRDFIKKILGNFR